MVVTPKASGSATTERPLRADAQRNQAKLIEAARAEFLEHGADAPLEDVARRAGVGIGTLYRRFPTRLDLLEAIYKNDVDAIARRADELVEQDDVWAAFTTWITEFSAYAVSKRALFQQLFDAIGKGSATMTHSRETVSAAMTAMLERAQQAGVVRTDVSASDVTRLVGGCTMMGALEPEQAERMVHVVLDGLRT